MTLRIGQIDYANCTPIFASLLRNHDCHAYRFVKGVPSQLNRMLANGEIDLCPSSSIEYGRHSGSYLMLPDLSISSVGPVKSVVLYSSMPVEMLDGAPIGLTSDSATSVALLRIIFKKFYRFSNRFVVTDASNPAEALQTCRAVLLIGDNALKSRVSSPGIHQYDLGELWYSLTGLPFVFALWMIRAESVVAMPEECALLCDRLRDAKREALSTLERLAAECSERNWMGEEELLSYWRTISYDLTPSHIEGVKLFFRYAVEMGILEEDPVLRFL